jgi:16S rRNA (guanine1207-N2)-methyltransferase
VARLPEGAHLWVDGQKTDGIDGILKDLRRLGLEVAATSKAHGKCLAFRSPGARAFRQWEPVPRSPAPGFAVPPGVFSADGIDPASALLAAQLPVKLSGRIGDLGAGWGWLSAEVLKRPDVTECHLVEAEFAAIEAARQAIADPRAVFHWADATTFRLPRPLDGIVMNPPFHEGRQAEPALGQAFIRAAAAMLAPHGRLWMVANRQLPYERTLADCFREVEEAPGDGRFKVLFAAHPKRLRPRLT